MKTITLEQAANLLDRAIFLDVEGVPDTVTYGSWGYSKPEIELEEKENENFLTVKWTDDQGDGFNIDFYSDDNPTVQVDNETMFLVSEEGNTEQIYLSFNYANLEERI